jgi:hypothetical protein
VGRRTKLLTRIVHASEEVVRIIAAARETVRVSRFKIRSVGTAPGDTDGRQG